MVCHLKSSKRQNESHPWGPLQAVIAAQTGCLSAFSNLRQSRFTQAATFFLLGFSLSLQLIAKHANEGLGVLKHFKHWRSMQASSLLPFITQAVFLNVPLAETDSGAGLRHVMACSFSTFISASVHTSFFHQLQYPSSAPHSTAPQFASSSHLDRHHWQPPLCAS